MPRYYVSRGLTILCTLLALRASWWAAVDGASLVMLPTWLALAMVAYFAAPALPEPEVTTE